MMLGHYTNALSNQNFNKGMMSLIPFIPPTHFLHYIFSHNMISAVLYQYRAVMYIRITMSTFNYKRDKHYT